MTRWHLAAMTAPAFALALLASQPANSQSAHDHQNPPGNAGSAPQPSGTRGDMMGRGMMQQPMMPMPGRMMGDDGMADRHAMMHQHMMGDGQGMMHGGMMGSGMMGSGMGGAMRVRPMVDTADVTEFFRRYLERQGNERLKLGKVAEADAGTITAEIVTVDDSLVETFTVDRVTGEVSGSKPGAGK